MRGCEVMMLDMVKFHLSGHFEMAMTTSARPFKVIIIDGQCAEENSYIPSWTLHSCALKFSS